MCILLSVFKSADCIYFKETLIFNLLQIKFSMERTIVVKRPGIQPTKVKVRIWNDTVSNLTLMALGIFKT